MATYIAPGLIHRFSLLGAWKTHQLDPHTFDMIVGITELNIGETSVTIEIGQTMQVTTYTVFPFLSNVTDANPSSYSIIVTNKTFTEFTVSFSSPLDTGNYVLEWMVLQ